MTKIVLAMKRFEEIISRSQARQIMEESREFLDGLISRLQAKQVLEESDEPKQIILDFDGVEAIGASFADEVFRVFQNQNPELRIEFWNAGKEVQQMINRAIAKKPSEVLHYQKDTAIPSSELHVQKDSTIQRVGLQINGDRGVIGVFI